MIPQGLGKQVLEQVLEKARSRSLEVVRRDDPPPKKDWIKIAQDKPREIKPLPVRDKSRDNDRER